mgnify:CR=1 FL=1
MKFEGIYTPVITPHREDGSIDPLISRQNKDPRFRGSSRFGDWQEEFRGYVADRTAVRAYRMPNLSILRLSNDHTAGLHNEAAQAQLGDVLGAVGGANALNAMGAAMKGGDDQVLDSGTRALGNWMEVDAAPLLLDLAQWGVSDPATLAFLDPPPVPAPAHRQCADRAAPPECCPAGCGSGGAG